MTAPSRETGVPTGVRLPRQRGRSVASRLLTEHYAQGRIIALSAGTQGCGENCPYVPGALANAIGRSRTRRAETTPRYAASSRTSTPACAT
jgi:hypothetical protein